MESKQDVKAQYPNIPESLPTFTDWLNWINENRFIVVVSEVDIFNKQVKNSAVYWTKRDHKAAQPC